MITRQRFIYSGAALVAVPLVACSNSGSNGSYEASVKSIRRPIVDAGRCYERFALQATALGIRTAVMNGLADAPATRQQLARVLGLTGGRLDMVVRFGRGPLMPSSLRRPLEDVMV